MKIEKLTENKIRIIFNIDELTKENIDLVSLAHDKETSEHLFKSILKQAEKEVGFDAGNSKLLIEAFFLAEGFFVITFTKLVSENTSISSTPLKVKAKRKIANTSCKTAIYEFSIFDDFCNFCAYINNLKLGNLKNFSKHISLYEYKSKYFLIFSDINLGFEHISLFYTSISEFAKLVSNSENFYSKLIEYGNIVFKTNAIQNGIKYFCKI